MTVNPVFKKWTLTKLQKKVHYILEYRNPLLEQNFKISLRGLQQDTNLKCQNRPSGWVWATLKIINGVRNTFPFKRCPSSIPEPISTVLMSTYAFYGVSANLEHRFWGFEFWTPIEATNWSPKAQFKSINLTTFGRSSDLLPKQGLILKFQNNFFCIYSDLYNKVLWHLKKNRFAFAFALGPHKKNNLQSLLVNHCLFLLKTQHQFRL